MSDVWNPSDALLRRVLAEGLDGIFEAKGDSDQHLLTLFATALASRGKVYVELGVRQGRTTLPLLTAAAMNGGRLVSVDIRPTEFVCPEELSRFWEFVESDAVAFLEGWERGKMDFVFLDDWHAYRHVKRELELLDAHVGPSSVILVHDLMYGGTQPFYHTDLSLREGQWAEGGPYRAVAELDPNFWEYATLPWNNGLTLLRKKYSSKYYAH
jgi:predicted O-methyltransferase YrrM